MTDHLELLHAEVPAYSTVLGETIDITYPAAWADYVEQLLPFLTYGPTFRRPVLWHVQEMTRNILDGYTALAWDHVVAAAGWLPDNVRRPSPTFGD